MSAPTQVGGCRGLGDTEIGAALSWRRERPRLYRSTTQYKWVLTTTVRCHSKQKAPALLTRGLWTATRGAEGLSAFTVRCRNAARRNLVPQFGPVNITAPNYDRRDTNSKRSEQSL